MTPITSSLHTPTVGCALAALILGAAAAQAEPIGCVTTAWRLPEANQQVCVEAFRDPKIAGVTCHVSQTKPDGDTSPANPAQDPSQFSLICTQTGPIALPASLPRNAEVFAEDTSPLFKETRVMRLWDQTNQTLVYLAISRKLTKGAQSNSISAVPVMPWGGRNGG